MTVVSGPYSFEIFFVHSPKARFSMREKVKTAASLTLQSLPRSTCQKLLKKETNYELTISFVGKAKIKQLNRQYRKKDRPTDVLSFSRLEGVPSPSPVEEVGDVIVCLEIARVNAIQDGIPASREVQTLVIHGILHLFGYDHETSPQDARRMFALQNKILKLCSL